MGWVSRSTSSINCLALASISSTASFPKKPGMTMYLVEYQGIRLREGPDGFKPKRTHSRGMPPSGMDRVVLTPYLRVGSRSSAILSDYLI